MITDIVGAISAHVNAALDRVKYPKLPDGGILLGRRHVSEGQTPRVVFVPMSSEFSAAETPNNMNPYGQASHRRRMLQRSLANDGIAFEVHVFGPPLPADAGAGLGFDATQFLYQQVIRSALTLAPGPFAIGNGTWVDQQDGDASQATPSTHHYAFGLTVATPVVDQALKFVPPDTVGTFTTGLKNADDAADADAEAP